MALTAAQRKAIQIALQGANFAQSQGGWSNSTPIARATQPATRLSAANPVIDFSGSNTPAQAAGSLSSYTNTQRNAISAVYAGDKVEWRSTILSGSSLTALQRTSTLNAAVATFKSRLEANRFYNVQLSWANSPGLSSYLLNSNSLAVANPTLTLTANVGSDYSTRADVQGAISGIAIASGLNPSPAPSATTLDVTQASTRRKQALGTVGLDANTAPLPTAANDSSSLLGGLFAGSLGVNIALVALLIFLFRR